MVIRQPLDGAVFQSFADEPPRRRTSRGKSLAIGASVVVHVMIGIYLYNAAFSAPAQIAAPSDTVIPGKWVTLTPLDKTKSVPPPPQPRIHEPKFQATTLGDTLHADTTPKTKLIDVQPPAQTLTGGNTVIVVKPDTQPTPQAKKITRPDWLARPDGEVMSRYYPDRAQRMGKGGLATISCAVSASGSIGACHLVSESPADYGFGDAALKLSRFFKMKPQREDG
ncbi:MAG TPA: TonB family protein, partial [Caulobacteraceae bacterium]